MKNDASKLTKLMVKAEQCTTRKKAKKILKKAAKLTPTQLHPNDYPSNS